MRLVALCLVKNEAQWIWYALMSVLDYVDEITIWDTGSTDQTVAIIQSIANPKIKLTQFTTVDPESFTRYRQQMLSQAQADWILILDGDEIWPTKTIQATLAAISSNSFDYLVHRSYNLVGDVYHVQESQAGKYRIGPYSGHLNIRAVNTHIPGLHFDLPYGHEGFFVNQTTPLQTSPARYTLIESPYLHATHLFRSPATVMQRATKYKYELGLPISATFGYPPCFYRAPTSAAVPSPWTPRSLKYLLISLVRAPFLFLKRR